MSRPELDLPYAWPPFGWPSLGAGPRRYELEAPAFRRSRYEDLYFELKSGPIRHFFAYVAVGDALPPEEGASSGGQGGPDLNVAGLRRLRAGEGRPQATRQVVLDMIDAAHFLDRALLIPPCPINDRAAAEARRIMISETRLLDPEQLRIATVLLSVRNEIEAGYIANFLPSTWHRVAIGEDSGLPLLLTEDYEAVDEPRHRLVYAAPTTFAEAVSLGEIISLNHLPDAGA